jgi:hypothetical protein
LLILTRNSEHDVPDDVRDLHHQLEGASVGEGANCGHAGLDEDLQVGLRLRHVGGGGDGSSSMIYVFVWI